MAARGSGERVSGVPFGVLGDGALGGGKGRGSGKITWGWGKWG